jgi:hypothetical protein
MLSTSVLRLSLAAASCLGLVGAYLIDPPTTAAQDTISDCSNWQIVSASDQCQTIAESNGITLSQLQTYVRSDSDRSTTIH